MDIETFKMRIQPSLEYLKERDSYGVVIHQMSNGGIRISIDNSAAVDGLALIDIDYEFDNANVNIRLPMESSNWMSFNQLEKCRDYIDDLFYLFKKVNRIVGSK